MKEFIELGKYGQLYIDKVLFESYFPVIFSCVNDNRDIFIGVCCQNNEKGCKWLLGKTNGISIARMLRDEITIRELLLDYSSEKISVDYMGNGYMVDYNNSDWNADSPYLPKEDSYMYAEDGEFEDEIDYFSALDYPIHDNAECYQCMIEVGGTVNIGIEPVADALAAVTLASGNILIPSEVVRAVKVFGEWYANFGGNTEEYKNQENYKSVYENTFRMLPEGLSIQVEVDNNTDVA